MFRTPLTDFCLFYCIKCSVCWDTSDVWNIFFYCFWGFKKFILFICFYIFILKKSLYTLFVDFVPDSSFYYSMNKLATDLEELLSALARCTYCDTLMGSKMNASVFSVCRVWKKRQNLERWELQRVDIYLCSWGLILKLLLILFWVQLVLSARKCCRCLF